MRHCDTYIDDESQPYILRRFLRWHRWPATYKIRAKRLGFREPTLYATFRRFFLLKTPVRVVFASRMGDVGITRDPSSDQYEQRVAVSRLSEFRE